MLHLQKNSKNALDKIPEMFVNCKQSSYWVTSFFLQLIWNDYPPRGRWTSLDMYDDASRVGIFHHYSPPL